MGKKFSVLRSGTKGIFLIPLLMAASLMFCTRNNDGPPYKITGNNDVLYSNIDLYMNPERSDELNIKRRGFGIRYDSDGSPFTGTQELRFVKNDSLFAETEYINGIMKSSVGYDNKGNDLDKYEYGYIGNQFKMIRQTKPSGLVVEKWSDAKPGEMGYHKKWHENGQLKYEAYFTENIQPEGLMTFHTKYQGLMTLYDEQGNILEQARYEDGELIKKIK